MNIIWRNIPSAPNYDASDIGDIKRRAGRILRPYVRSSGYHVVGIMKNNKHYTMYVHRLVGEAFLGSPTPEKPCVAHLDGNPGNNQLDNLLWVSYKENEEHKKLHKTNMIGSKNSNSKLRIEDITSIRSRRLNGEHLLSLGKEYGVSKHTIFNVVARRSWSHVQ